MMANAQVVWSNRFKKMELSEAEYQILKVAEDHRAGRDIGDYFGTHTRTDELIPLYEQAGDAVMETLDSNGIIEPYGHPFRFVVTEKGRLLMRIYVLTHAVPSAAAN